MNNYFFIPKYFDNNYNVSLIYRIGPNSTCEIINIYSANQNQGYGSIVYRAFEELVKAEYQSKNIYAFTRFTNKNAVRWYLKMGFLTTVIPDYYWDEPENKAIILTKNI